MRSNQFSNFLNNTSYYKKAIGIIILFFIFKVILSFFLALGNDESYYWTYAQQLQINYFDHPPLVAVWIKFFTANLLLEDYVFFLRFGSFVGAAISSLFIYKTIAAISNEKAGFTGVFLYNISFYSSVTAGLFIMPDAPQMVFWTASMYFVTQIIKNDTKWFAWIFFGLTAGLCIMSKVHGVFLWGGMFLFALFYKRVWFKNPAFYISILITSLIVSPILIWNIQNDFITYRFHSERVTVNTSNAFNFLGIIKEIVGQVVINNPFNIVLIILFFTKRFSSKRKSPLRVYKLMGVPLLIIIFIISLFRTTLPHWSGPAYISLLPIAAIGLSEISFTRYKFVFKSAIIYFVVVVVCIIAAVNFYPGSFSNEKEIGKNDISLDAYGWKEGGKKFAVFYNVKHPDGKNKPPLVCNTWWGAHDEYYFARPLKIKMLGLGPVLNIHQYAWRNKTNSIDQNMDTAYCIVHSYDNFNVQKAFENYYNKIDSVHTIPILRGDKISYNFYVWRLSGWKGGLSLNSRQTFQLPF